MKEYITRVSIPILWEVLFVVSCVFLPEQYAVYTNFLFYFGIIIFFIRNNNFSLKELKANLTAGKKFWMPVGVTFLFLALAFVVSYLPKMFFHNLDSGMINLERNTWTKLIAFAISTIIFPCLAEELFYRKAMINFKSKKMLFLSTIVSLFLFALEHSITPYGILQAMIWGIPFSIAYIKTKNIYIPMTAHFISDFIGNFPSVVITTIHFLH